MHNISLKVPDKLLTDIEQITKLTGKNQSTIVREALHEYVSHVLLKPKHGSFLDQAQHLCGCYNGPSDLSTNPHHMEGFGE